MKFRNPFQSAADRLISKEVEHKLYEKASIDIENNDIDKGVWTKAFTKADGDEVKQKAVYIELMVEHYRDEIRAGEEIAKVLATKAEKEKEKQEEERKIREEEEEEKKRHGQWLADAPERKKRQDRVHIIFITVMVISTIIYVFLKF